MTTHAEALEAARRIVDGTWRGADMEKTLARALLSSSQSLQARCGALEEAAQLAFDQTTDNPAFGDWNDACSDIAARIRALKDKP